MYRGSREGGRVEYNGIKQISANRVDILSSALYCPKTYNKVTLRESTVTNFLYGWSINSHETISINRRVVHQMGSRF